MEFEKILQFMHEALLYISILYNRMAKLAISNKEVPVGCVFVDNDTNEIIAKAHNLTNISKNVSCLLILGNFTLWNHMLV